MTAEVRDEFGAIAPNPTAPGMSTWRPPLPTTRRLEAITARNSTALTSRQPLPAPSSGVTTRKTPSAPSSATKESSIRGRSTG